MPLGINNPVNPLPVSSVSAFEAIGGGDSSGGSMIPSLAAGAGVGTRAVSAPLKWAGRCDRSTALNYTLRQLYLSPIPFWGLYLIHQNACDTQQVNCKASVAVSNGTGANGYTPSGVWTPVPFGGVATYSTAVAVSGAETNDCVPGNVKSDIVLLNSVGRQDGGPGYPLFLDVYTPSAGNTENSRYAIGAPAETLDTIGVKCYFVAGDCIATPANFVSPTEWDNAAPVYPVLLTGAKPFIVLAGGDSLIGGVDSLTPVFGAGRIAANMMNAAGKPTMFVNQGFGGQTADVSLTNSIQQLQAHRPKAAAYSPWSPNDVADRYTALGVSKALARAVRWADECAAVGTLAGLVTPAPVGGITAGNESFRRQVVEGLKSICSTGVATLIDNDSVWTDYSNPAGGWKPGLGFNTVHPNYAGHQLAASQVWLPAYQRWAA